MVAARGARGSDRQTIADDATRANATTTNCVTKYASVVVETTSSTTTAPKPRLKAKAMESKLECNWCSSPFNAFRYNERNNCSVTVQPMSITHWTSVSSPSVD